MSMILISPSSVSSRGKRGSEEPVHGVSEALAHILEKDTALAIPLAVVNMQQLKQAIEGTADSYNRAMEATLQRLEADRIEDPVKVSVEEVRGQIVQSAAKMDQVLELCLKIVERLGATSANQDLEREVLTKLRSKLGD